MPLAQIDYTGRVGPTPFLWHHVPTVTQLRDDPSRGFYWSDDFVELASSYTATQAGSSGTFTLADAEGGVAKADCASTTVTNGINVQLDGACFKPQAGLNLVFEARVKATDIATGPEFFLGLHETDTTIISGSAMSGSNWIGWKSVTDDGVLLFTGADGGTEGTNTATTLSAGTWVQLGFHVRTEAGVVVCDQWIDGVKQADTTQLAAANIPGVVLTPSLVCQSDGSTDSIVHIDWWQTISER